MFDIKSLKEYIFPVSMLSGSIIGVGFLSLPYVALNAGILLTFFYLVVLAGVVILINTIVGEISLRTPDFKRMPGFAEYHLGKWAKAVMLFTSIAGGIAVLLVYIIAGSELLMNVFGGSSHFFFALIYFIFALIFISADVKAISKVELATVALFLLVLLGIFIKGFFKWDINNLFLSYVSFDFKNLFLPYGAILFSLWGVGLIPEVEEMMQKNSSGKKEIKKVIAVSVLIPLVVYFIFILLVLGITGIGTSESALLGINYELGGWMAKLGLLAGAVITFNAFISLGLIIKKVLMYDLGIKKTHSVAVVCFVPMILFLMGFRDFIPLISFIGGIFLGIDGIIIMLMYKKIGGKKAVAYSLSLVFLLGMAYEIFYSFL